MFSPWLKKHSTRKKEIEIEKNMASRVHVAVRIRPSQDPRPRPNQSPPSSRPSSPSPGARPLISVEDESTIRVLGKSTAICSDSREGCLNTKEAADSTRYRFDHVFGHNSTQEQVYASSVRPLVDSFLVGYNCTAFVYGQTGSGKTWTMGTEVNNTSLETQGFVIRALNDIFMNLTDKSWEATLSVIEIYNEEIFDLLRPSSTNLVLRENELGEVKAVGVTDYPVTSSQECFSVLRQALSMRSTSTTAMNQRSSRSHAIITISLFQRITKPDTSGTASKVMSKFNFVDLAGSERINKSATTGDRRREGIAINHGLLVLGQVINALTDSASNKTSDAVPTSPSNHVPYRDSKLTRVLQSALGGNSRTLMLVCISSDDSDYSESVGSLRYGIRARSIRQKAVVNIQTNSSSELSLKKENERLQAIILRLRSEAYSFKEVPVIHKEMVPFHDFLSDFEKLNVRASEFKSKLTSIPLSHKLAWH